MEQFSCRTDDFEKLFCSLVQTNKLFNLTAVTDEVGVSALHFADSLLVLPFICKALGVDKTTLCGGQRLQSNAPVTAQKPLAKLLDIGCGAGFPSLPLAIVCPSLDVLGVDSTAKKTQFSANFAKCNGISNFSALSARAEELAKTEKRESYDIVCARAVARLNVLCELCLPFVKEGGYFIALKGSKGKEELSEAVGAIEKLGGTVTLTEERQLVLPDQSQSRTFIMIKKVAQTPVKYPRLYSKIVKDPL